MDKRCAYPACGKRADGICTGCRLSRYCCKDHQVLHWEEHRLSCNVDKENRDTHAGTKPHNHKPVLEPLLVQPSTASVSSLAPAKETKSYLAKPNILFTLTSSAGNIKSKPVEDGQMDKRCAYPACGKRSDGICTGCRLSRYCSKEHQVLHWKEHRLSCKLDQENLDTHTRKPLDAIINHKPVLGSLLVQSSTASVSLAPSSKETTSYLAKPNTWFTSSPSAGKTKSKPVEAGYESSLQHPSITALIKSATKKEISPIGLKITTNGHRESMLPFYNDTRLDLGFVLTPTDLTPPKPSAELGSTPIPGQDSSACSGSLLLAASDDVSQGVGSSIIISNDDDRSAGGASPSVTSPFSCNPPAYVNFDICEVFTSRRQYILLENLSLKKGLALELRIDNSQDFHIELGDKYMDVLVVQLDYLQEREIRLVFTPNSMGLIATQFHLIPLCETMKHLEHTVDLIGFGTRKNDSNVTLRKKVADDSCNLATPCSDESEPIPSSPKAAPISSYSSVGPTRILRSMMQMIVFKDTEVGCATTGEVTVSNSSHTDQVIYVKDISSPFISDWKRKREILQAKSSIRIPVIFAPVAAGPHFGTLCLGIENSTEFMVIPLQA